MTFVFSWFFLLLKSVELSSPAFYASCNPEWLRFINFTFVVKGPLHLPKIEFFI